MRKYLFGSAGLVVLIGVLAVILEGMIEKLPDADCREAVRQLKEMRAQAATLDAVFQQERLWARRTHSLRGQIVLLLSRSSQERSRQ